MTLPKLVKHWPAVALEQYEERAGIKEFDGRMPRDQAEREAEAEVRLRWKAEQETQSKGVRDGNS